MERQFDIQLEKLRTRVLKMCSLVDEQLDFALKAYEEVNLDLAQAVIEQDLKVDKYDLKIEKICQKIIALNQPVAMDLRYVMSALTMNTNLERIGDLTVNIAEVILRDKVKPEFLNKTHFYAMANLAKSMLKDAIDAYIQGDPALAEKVIKLDNTMDKYDYENYEILIDIMKQDSKNIDLAVPLLTISRDIERIADHSTNIAEDVYFIVQAQIIKHKYEKYFFDEDAVEEDD